MYKYTTSNFTFFEASKTGWQIYLWRNKNRGMRGEVGKETPKKEMDNRTDG